MKEFIKSFNFNIFEYLSNSENQIFFLTDAESKGVYWTSNAKKIFNIDTDFNSFFEWKKLVHTSDYEKLDNAFRKIQRRHTLQFSEEFRFLSRSGE